MRSPFRAPLVAFLFGVCVACATTSTSSVSEPEPSVPAATPKEQDAWRALARELGPTAGGVESKSEELQFSLARSAFFDERATTLEPGGTALAERIAAVARDVGRAVRIEIRLEDAAASQPDASRIAAARGEALRSVFAKAGARSTVVLRTTPFEGDYDGPLELDPSSGRIDFALVGDDGRILRGSPE